MTDTCGIGLIGWGTVGSGVVDILAREGTAIAQRCGRGLSLRAVVTAHPDRDRGQDLPADCRLGSDPSLVFDDPDIECVLLLVGGTDIAKDLCLQAMAAGKHVVTANKAILATAGTELFEAADRHGVCLSYESSVAGGVPVVHAIRDGLVGNRIDAIQGILNGTCNYILTMMEEEGLDYQEALQQAKDLGYAEADPTLDIDGTDTAHKIAILARLVFNTAIDFSDVSIQGIEQIGPGDIESARRLGCRIKLLGIAQRFENGISIAAAPILVPLEHSLANVRMNYNAINIEADAAGPTMLQGQGAGSRPTASAVIADTVAIATGERQRSGPRAHAIPFYDLPVIDDQSEKISFYVRYTVVDRPGVLAIITRIFGEHGISLRSLHQDVPEDQRHAVIEILTHTCTAKRLHECVQESARAVETTADTVILEHI
ncbi:MAG: homoserine dehydrogenase [Planctomycetota bacterium]